MPQYENGDMRCRIGKLKGKGMRRAAQAGITLLVARMSDLKSSSSRTMSKRPLAEDRVRAVFPSCVDSKMRELLAWMRACGNHESSRCT